MTILYRCAKRVVCAKLENIVRLRHGHPILGVDMLVQNAGILRHAQPIRIRGDLQQAEFALRCELTLYRCGVIPRIV